MASTREAAAWKVLFYARLYSKNRVHNISQNMTSIRDGWSSNVNAMAAAMSGNRCLTQNCETLAKQTAIAWLKANNVPYTAPTPPKLVRSPCRPQKTARDAGFKVLYYLKHNHGLDFIGDSRLFLRTIYPTNEAVLQDIIHNWSDCNRKIQVNLDCNNNCINQVCEDCARKVAAAWVKANPFKASGGSTGGAQQKQQQDKSVDADCNQYGFFKGACVAWKSISKGTEGALQNPLTQYLPIMLIGMGFLAILMLAKK